MIKEFSPPEVLFFLLGWGVQVTITMVRNFRHFRLGIHPPKTRLEIVLKEHGGAVDECVVVSLGTLGNHRKTGKP